MEDNMCFSPRDLRWLANKGDGPLVDPGSLAAGRDAAATPIFRTRIRDASLAVDGLRESAFRAARRAEVIARRAMDRRMALHAMLGGLVAAGALSDDRAKAQLAAAGSNPGGRLPFAPPDMTGATTYMPTDRSPQIHAGPGKAIILWPATALTNFMRFLGHDVATDILSVGGAANPVRRFDTTTMAASKGGAPAIWCQASVTGATGGMIRFQTQATNTPSNPARFTPYRDIGTIAPGQIQADFDAALGAGHLNAVTDVSSAGARSWRFVPQYPTDGVGLVTIDKSKLAGSPAVTGKKYIATSDMAAEYQQWTGHFHSEGTYLGGNEGYDALDIATWHRDAILTMQNCHNRAGLEWWNNDWLHLDGAQFFAGPAKFYAYQCDYITDYGNGLIDQPRKAIVDNGGNIPNLEALYNRYIRKILTQCHQKASGRSGIAFYVEEDWPSQVASGKNFYNQAYLWYDAEGCYTNIVDAESGKNVTTAKNRTYFSRFVSNLPAAPSSPTGNLIYPGILPRAQVPTATGFFCNPAANQCGLRYVSPGYQSPGTLPNVAQCLDGEKPLQSSYPSAGVSPFN